ncbi:MAG: alkylmercury lyase family protein [Dehalococcoidia bacterium]|nr:alkylmercury lyase family protein [Dehalococcoidia bacterium]
MTTYATIALPAALGDRLRAVQHLAAAPTTLGEYVAAPDRHRSFIDPSGMYCDSSQSCCGTHAEHEIAMGGVTRRTHCVLDTLLLAALEGATASVRSVSPLSGAVVKLEVGADGVTAEPSSAVMSFGLRNEDGESVFDTLCPYLNAFLARGVSALGRRHPGSDDGRDVRCPGLVLRARSACPGARERGAGWLVLSRDAALEGKYGRRRAPAPWWRRQPVGRSK